MIIGIIITILVAFGLGALAATVVSWVRHRNAVPVWARQTDRNGNHGGKL